MVANAWEVILIFDFLFFLKWFTFRVEFANTCLIGFQNSSLSRETNKNLGSQSPKCD